MFKHRRKYGYLGGKIGGKKAVKTMRREGTGLFDIEVKRKGGKRTHELYPEQVKEWSRKAGKKAQITHKKQGTGFFDVEVNRMGGSASVEANRKNSPYIWLGVHFMSKQEMEFARTILTKPIVNINCHIKMKGGIIDFFPQSYDKKYKNKFVEYHPWDRKLTEKEYYKSRRDILDNNGFKNYELVVVK